MHLTTVTRRLTLIQTFLHAFIFWRRCFIANFIIYNFCFFFVCAVFFSFWGNFHTCKTFKSFGSPIQLYISFHRVHLSCLCVLSKSYQHLDKEQSFPDHKVPLWNFTDIFHSFMVVFRALCGEWVESMYDCVLVNGLNSIVYFYALAFIGSFVVSYYFTQCCC